MSQGSEAGLSGLKDTIGGTPVEGGAHLPSVGAGYSDQQVLDLINFQEWLDTEIKFAASPEVDERFGVGATFEDIAKQYLDEMRGG